MSTMIKLIRCSKNANLQVLPRRLSSLSATLTLDLKVSSKTILPGIEKMERTFIDATVFLVYHLATAP